MILSAVFVTCWREHGDRSLVHTLFDEAAVLASGLYSRCHHTASSSDPAPVPHPPHTCRAVRLQSAAAGRGAASLESAERAGETSDHAE